MTLNLIRVASYEAEYPVDCSLKRAFELLEPKLRPPLATTRPTPEEYLLLNKAILYGVLCETHCAKTHIKHLHAIVTDGYGLFASLIAKVVNELYTKLVEPVKCQLIWVTKQMIDVQAVGVHDLLVCFLRQIVGGDFCDGNLWLCFEIVSMFLTKWDSLVEVEPMILTSGLYTYLRLVADHHRLTSNPKLELLKQLEIDFCTKVLREQFSVCSKIGRDLVRLLQDLVHIPNFRAVLKDLVLNQGKFKTPGFSVMSQLYNTRTSSRYTLLRISPEMETQLRFLLTYVKLGSQKRYQEWFAKKFLCEPNRETLIVDIVRFICCAHPPNKIIQSDIIPRWAVVGWLLKYSTKNYVQANVKLALLYDWLFFDERVDNIMNIEPATILLWDVDSGLAQIDKYFHSNDNHVIAGALLGVGIVNCSIKNDCDPALALLGEYIDKEDPSIRIGAIMGLGIAYAGDENEQIRSKLTPILNDAKAPLDVITFAAISLGLIYVGSCNEEVAQAIIFALMDRSDAELGEPLARLIPLSLGLLFLGKQESAEATLEVSKTFHEKIRKQCDMTLLSCAYAGTGNVLKVQNLLGHCSQHLEKGETHQGPAVLGIAMIAMAEELGLEMAIRSLEHLLQYGEQNIRRAVPLALGLLCISNPKVTVMDTLSRLSHDTDSEVAMAAVISLGVIGAGTNNARIAAMLRNLSSYYYKDASLLFCVRIAQGLVHLGKGLLTLNPYHSDRFLLSPAALGGIITMLHACLDMKAIILGKYHYVLYFLILAMQPRMLLTVDENLKPLSVPVQIGQAVDVVGQAGRPKTITGFQTHSTPVLLAAGDRAELATENYIPLSPILEGFVILKENPDYREE